MYYNPKRAKLNTKIESEVHKFIQGISEGVYDRLNIYVRRNDLPIEPEVLNALLKTMQASITEFEMKGIDQFNNSIRDQLDEYVGEETEKENPTEITSAVSSVGSTATVSSKKRVKSASFSV